MSFWILGVWILPTCLEFAGYSPDDLSSRGQALMHLIIDFGQLGLTIAILYQRLKAYKPWRLGWFRSYWQPIHKWLGPVLGAAVLFPLLASVAEQAQVACFGGDLESSFQGLLTHSVMCKHKLMGFSHHHHDHVMACSADASCAAMNALKVWSDPHLLLQIWFPFDDDLWAQNLEQQIMVGEPVSNMLYFVVVTCCAPIWEEVSLLPNAMMCVCVLAKVWSCSLMHISVCVGQESNEGQVLLLTISTFATGNVQRVLVAVSQKVHAHVCFSGADVHHICNGSFQLATLCAFGSPWAYFGYSLLVFAKFGCTNNVAQSMECIHFLEFAETWSWFLMAVCVWFSWQLYACPIHVP